MVTTLVLAWGALLLRSVAAQRSVPNTVAEIGLAVAVVGPGLTASVILGRRYGNWAVLELLRRVCMWPFRGRWYLVVLAAPPAIALVGVVGYQLTGADSAAAARELVQQAGGLGPIGLLGTFGVGFVLAVGQELGWRGYALPILQSDHSALFASLVLGLIWTVWLMPLDLASSVLRQSAVDLTSVGLGLANTVAVSVLFTWIYNNTFGSLLGVSLFRSMNILVAGLLPGFTAWDNHAGAVSLLAVRCLAVTLVIVFAGPRYLSRRDPRDHPYLDCPVTALD